MLWAALRLSAPADTTPPPHDAACAGLATWALQFTPRVVRVQNAVLMEVEASVRLFGGRRALHLRVGQEARELGVTDLAWAPTGQGALALATAGVDNGLCEPLDSLLDSLPMQALGAVLPHAPTLAQLGCRTLGDVRHLPRGGLSRRFGPDLLIALDQAYGLRAESYRWVELPEIFQAKVELMARVETAPALLFGARRLLLQLAGWLAARHCGVTALTLSWVFDSMRPRDAGPGGELTVRTAKPLRDVEHLSRLLAEHLAQLQLAAPVESLALHAVEVHPLQQHSRSLLPDPQHAAESLALALERITARLGESRVQRPVLVEDSRPEWSQRWQTASLPLPRLAAAPDGLPQPTFLLPEPLRLATRNHRPLHQGELQLLLGPHRVEGGWWHRAVQDGQDVTLHVARDYWVALSAHAGVLWLFQTRLAQDETAWFLHGVFA